jgi:hypothetical protein
MSTSNEDEGKCPSLEPMTLTEINSKQAPSILQSKSSQVAEEASNHCYCNGTGCDSPADCPGAYSGHEDLVNELED